MTKRYISPPNWPVPPPGWAPPSGWKPDPRWGPAPQGWAFWREDESWFIRHKLLVGLAGGCLGVLILVSAVGGAGTTTRVADSQSNSASYSPSAAGSPATSVPASTPANANPTPKTSTAPAPATSTAPAPTKTPPSADSEYGAYPPAENKFVSIVETAQDAAEQADNDLQRGAALSKRDASLCKAVGNGKVQDWVGKISGLESNSDGLGVLTIDIADGDAVATWNNAFSDYADNTLIRPGKLLDSLTAMEEGQRVKFSGRFANSNGCVNDSRLTKAGKLDDPEFIFKFSSVEAI